MNDLDYNLEYLKKYLHPKDDYEKALLRLKAGEPVQYIVGDVDFYGNVIKVNKNVLIPRRETEELVEKTNEYLKKYFPNLQSILDMGTGSGCIAITLKKLFPNVNITASDISQDALKVAIDNAKNNNVDINFLHSDIFSNISQKYDCLISNPPYISQNEEIMDIVKNNEPHLALFASQNGLYFYHEILHQCKNYLNDKFLLAFEIGATQGNELQALAKELFPTAKISIEQDLQHFDRFLFIINE